MAKPNKRPAMLRSIRFRLLCICAVVTLVSWSPLAFAYQFELDANEWSSWPAYCQARYVTSTVGRRSMFRNKVPQESIRYWESVVGAEAFLHIHHYCAGMIWLLRAHTGSNVYPRNFLINRAIDEARYTFRNIGAGNPMAPQVASTLAEAYLLDGDKLSAENLIAELILEQPKSSNAYVAGAVVYYRAGELKLALDLMEKGRSVVENPTAEFYYNFGLILLELDRPSEARQYAEKAYDMGYPLPGLKRRLGMEDNAEE